MALVSVNPSTGETLASYDEMSAVEVADALYAAGTAFQHWSRTPFAERASALRHIADLLRSQQQSFAVLMAQEMGKPLAQGEAEIDKCASCCEYYAAHGEAFLSPEYVETEASRSYVAFQPLGVVLGVMPWNFPFWQVVRYVAPTLMAGNAALLKHASNVTGCALALEEVIREAVPPGLFSVLRLPSSRLAPVVADPSVRAVTLTGSTPAGREVAALAGRVLKKTVLELGGSDAYVILDDADLDQAASICVYSRLINSGQSCVSAKRFVVTERNAEAFTARVVALMRHARMGNPLEGPMDVGPMARRELRDELHQQVTRSLEAGAVAALGCEVPEGPGAFYPPSVLTGVRKGMPAYDEELFGPVAAIITVRDEDKAIRVANDSVFGLGAAVFTRDVARGERIAAEQLEAGNCFVNAFVRSHPRLPFGGIKDSGYGRELSAFGIREFVNVKTVYVA